MSQRGALSKHKLELKFKIKFKCKLEFELKYYIRLSKKSISLNLTFSLRLHKALNLGYLGLSFSSGLI
jgi:hypothetical protein